VAVHGPAAIICPAVGAGGWYAVDLATRQVSSSPVVSADCTASNVDRIFTFSRGFAKQAVVVNDAAGNGQPGYVLANQTDAAGFVDAASPGPSASASAPTSGQAAQAAQISTPIFDPANGQLWWTQGGHLYSNTDPPSTAVDHGPGMLYTFTPSGEPMPGPVFTSPDGSEVAVPTVAGFTYGPSSTMTSACVEGYAVAAKIRGSTLPGGVFCGGQTVNASTAPGRCTFMIGWVSSSDIACLTSGPDATGNGTGSGGYSNAVAVYHLGQAAGVSGTMLIPPSDTAVFHAEVSPDGKDVLFVTSDYTTKTIALDLVPTDGSGAHTAPQPIEHWTSGLSSAEILGWIQADGKLAS
jgi:hypothetical protein